MAKHCTDPFPEGVITTSGYFFLSLFLQWQTSLCSCVSFMLFVGVNLSGRGSGERAGGASRDRSLTLSGDRLGFRNFALVTEPLLSSCWKGKFWFAPLMHVGHLISNKTARSLRAVYRGKVRGASAEGMDEHLLNGILSLFREMRNNTYTALYLLYHLLRFLWLWGSNCGVNYATLPHAGGSSFSSWPLYTHSLQLMVDCREPS